MSGFAEGATYEQINNMHSLTNKIEIIFQAFLVANQDEDDLKRSPSEFFLENGVLVSEDLSNPNKQDLAKPCFKFQEKKFTQEEIISVRHNIALLLLGNLILATDEALSSFLKEKANVNNILNSTNINSNVKSLYIIIHCLRNAFAHNPCDPYWKIDNVKPTSIYRQKCNFVYKTNTYDFNFNELNNMRVDFNKHFNGFSYMMNLLLICRCLFNGSITISDISIT